MPPPPPGTYAPGDAKSSADASKDSDQCKVGRGAAVGSHHHRRHPLFQASSPAGRRPRLRLLASPQLPPQRLPPPPQQPPLPRHATCDIHQTAPHNYLHLLAFPLCCPLAAAGVAAVPSPVPPSNKCVYTCGLCHLIIIPASSCWRDDHHAIYIYTCMDTYLPTLDCAALDLELSW